MKIFVNRILAGSAGPINSAAAGSGIARDVARMVVTAIIAGTAFALLLALSVLSLTVIAPPAQASGAPTVESFEPLSPDAHGDKSARQLVADATPVHPATESRAPQMLPTPQAQAAQQDSAIGALVKAVSPGVMLILALVAGLLGFFVYSVVRRKA
jgi:hypothetical protein